jgi:hypothetical protein
MLAGCLSDRQNDVSPTPFADVGRTDMLTLGKRWADVSLLSGELLHHESMDIVLFDRATRPPSGQTPSGTFVF